MNTITLKVNNPNLNVDTICIDIKDIFDQRCYSWTGDDYYITSELFKWLNKQLTKDVYEVDTMDYSFMYVKNYESSVFDNNIDILINFSNYEVCIIIRDNDKIVTSYALLDEENFTGKERNVNIKTYRTYSEMNESYHDIIRRVMDNILSKNKLHIMHNTDDLSTLGEQLFMCNNLITNPYIVKYVNVLKMLSDIITNTNRFIKNLSHPPYFIKIDISVLSNKSIYRIKYNNDDNLSITFGLVYNKNFGEIITDIYMDKFDNEVYNDILYISNHLMNEILLSYQNSYISISDIERDINEIMTGVRYA